MKLFLFLALFCLFSSYANANSYYPDHLQGDALLSLRGKELRETLHGLVSKRHVKRSQKNDLIVDKCQKDLKSGCRGHRVLGYKEARRILFGKLHLEQNASGHFIKDVYCHKKFTRKHGVGVSSIPNHRAINCEHTWPQSRFSREFSREMQKSDLHHLFPTDSRANSIRGNFEFANIRGGELDNGCEESQLGNGGRTSYFQPPFEHRGNVARAIFYFSIRYRLKVSDTEERALRHWHRIDPVDWKERERNNLIYQVQGNRNPFIDRPELVRQVDDF